MDPMVTSYVWILASLGNFLQSAPQLLGVTEHSRTGVIISPYSIAGSCNDN
jgi:hypothetical protein